MFTRNSSTEPRSIETRRTNGSGNVTMFSAAAPASTEKSIIGNDLKIIGQGLKIVGRGLLQVDGEIEGDVQGAEVVVGEKGKVTGMVAGRNVIVRGTVSGVVCGRSIGLQASSHVEGDLHHMTLIVEQGAMFEGRSRRAPDEAALSAVVEGRVAGPEGPEERQETS